MGDYLNIGNAGFAAMTKADYVDKTGLIRFINHTLGTTNKLTCVSRPRRFGKSFAAKMLCAYYDKSCDSRKLFEGLEISKDASFETYLNRYDVIYLDVTEFVSDAVVKGNLHDVVRTIEKKLIDELYAAYPQVEQQESLPGMLYRIAEETGNPFIFIIDEWDALFREAKEDVVLQAEYISLLRGLFKNSAKTDKMIAAAYMTGILPIKKDGLQSAISDFREFSMIKPRQFGRYVGFTEKEVQNLCRNYHRDFAKMKQWYDGYTFRNVGSVYNPNSVMEALRNDDVDSYWTETSAAESLMGYIALDFDGLSKVIAELIGGAEVRVNTSGFANDLVTFQNRDDVLTLLIHLGYLAYDEENEKVHIPNEEIRREFAKTIRNVRKDDTIRRVRESDQLILDTVHMDTEAVAGQIEKIHAEESVLHYNNEQALRSVIKRAYFSYGDEFILFEELPSGDGYADIVYFPKKDFMMPALLIELKWNQSAEGAISQIKERHYPEAIRQYGGEILLVGINYDKDAPVGKRKHTCVIERYHSKA